MGRLLFVLLYIFLSSPFFVYGQNTQEGYIHFDTSSNGITVADALQLIRNQTSYKPSFITGILPLNKRLPIKEEEMPLSDLLDLIVEGEDIHYIIRNGLILFVASNPGENDEPKYTLQGVVRERQTGEALIGATLWIDSLKVGASTNGYGFYSLTLPKGKHRIAVSFVGFQAIWENVDLKGDLVLNYHLELTGSELPEIIVSPTDFEEMSSGINTGYHKISRNIFGKIPYFLGEVDVMQGMLLLPGIRNVGEDASGINVRGGSTDHNLILLDEAIIFNTSHFFGLISVFNPESINDVEIYKGDIPASYGGRLSSVLNVRQREGNKERFSLSGGLGLLSGRLVAEGPIKKNKSSFLVSTRSTLFNLNYFGPDQNNLRRSTVNFRDMNMKVNYDLNSKNTFYLSGYMGRDRNRIGEDFLRTWGNNTLTGRWNHVFGDKLFSNHTATVSEYSYRTQDPSEISNFVGTSYIFNYTVKSDFDYYINPTSTLSFGQSSIIHQLNPGDRIPLSEDASVIEIKLDSEHAVEPAFYASWKKSWTSKLKSTTGLRWSRFYYMGPSNVYLYHDHLPRRRTTIVDTLIYSRGELIDYYNGFEPRVLLSYGLSKASILKASYNRNYQYIHRISNSISPAPTDIWKLSDSYILPERSDQWSLGYYRHIAGQQYEVSVEGYYKDLQNVIAYKDEADLLLNETLETEVLQGIGRAYGAELLFRKPEGKFRGWLSYTISRSETKINGSSPEEKINNGEFFPSDYDKTHDISVAGIYQPSERLSFSTTFNYSTGRPITLPVSKYVFDGVVVPNFTRRNGGRLSDYHRLDLSATLEGKKSARKFKGSWTFSIYNVYARRNAYSYLFRQSETDPQQTEIIRYSVLGTIIPSVSYNFKF